MRTLIFAAALIAAPAAAQEENFVGEYSLAEGPDVGGGLLIKSNGRFLYLLAAGALDERAEGRWETHNDTICLFTEPRPVPPVFAKGTPIEVDGKVPTLLVTWPTSESVSGIIFRIGFDSGEPAEGYTQFDGWTMPADDKRTPLWVEINEPIYNVTAPRFDLTPADGGKLRVNLIPNDMGTVDMDGACIEKTARGIVLHRKEGDLNFRKL